MVGFERHDRRVELVKQMLAGPHPIPLPQARENHNEQPLKYD